VIRLSQVSFTYPGASQPALRDLTHEIARGSFVAIAGSNGSGKSSLVKTFTGIIPHAIQGTLRGTVMVAGHDVARASIATMARHVGYVCQDFENQLLKPRVDDDVAFGPSNLGCQDHRARALRALDAVGATALAGRIVWELSGGEQHLVALAGALALDPGVLVIDEPAAQLDPAHAHRVYQLLAELRRARGTTIVVIEHHAELIVEHCDSLVLLDGGAVRWHRPIAEAFRRTAELRQAGLAPPVVTQVARAVAQQAGVIDAMLPLRIAEASATLEPRAPEAPAVPLAPVATADRSALVELEHVALTLATLQGAPRRVLDGVSLRITRGERVALIGANGAGKSSLVRLLTGLSRPGAGRIRLAGHDIAHTPPERLADHIAWVPQDPQRMFLEATIAEDVALYFGGRGIADAHLRVQRVLQDFGLAELAQRNGRLVSGGQMRRAALAIAAAIAPMLVLLDEPTASLDAAQRAAITTLIARLGADTTVIIASHDMELVANWATRVVVLAAGRIIADTTPDAFFADATALAQSGVVAPEAVRLAAALGIRPVPRDLVGLAACLRWRGAAAAAHHCGAST
jgi:energy-coupling factor transport system ATP-binding protein